jgi:hypothetical protein
MNRPDVYLRLTADEAEGLYVLASLGRDQLDQVQGLFDASREGKRRRSAALSALSRLSSKALTPELETRR